MENIFISNGTGIDFILKVCYAMSEGDEMLPKIVMIVILVLGFAANRIDAATLTYTVKSLEPATHRIRVTCEVAGLKTKSLTLNWATYLDCEKVIKLDIIKARLKSGKSIGITETESGWTVANEGRKDFAVEYEMTLDQRFPQRGRMGYLCAEYFLSFGAWTFLVPEDLPEYEYRVKFEMPKGWKIATPWKVKKGAYYAPNQWQFVNASIAAGDLEFYEENIGGTKARLVLDKRFGQATMEKIREKYYSKNGVYASIKNIFKTTTPDEHLSILMKASGFEEWQWVNESCFSQAEAATDLYSAFYQMSHRILHTYNLFYPNGMKIEPTWFAEGVTEYYCDLTLTYIHSGRPLDRLRDQYSYTKSYRDLYEGSLDGILRFPGNWDHELYLAYSKGALVAYLLDVKIRQATKNNKSLNDVIATLYAKYGRCRSGSVTEAIIEETASGVAGTDLSDFFDTYIRKSTVVDLDYQMRDDDLDGMMNGFETLFGSDSAKWDTDGDGCSDYIEFRDGTKALDSYDKPKRQLYIDGDLSDWSKQKPVVAKDASDDAAGDSDIVEVGYFKKDGYFYLYMKLKQPPIPEKRLRYYINIDFDGDGIAEMNAAAVAGLPGDTSRFHKDWSTYDWQSADDVEAMECFVGASVEMQIPMKALGLPDKFTFTAGVWDAFAGKGLDSIGNLKVE